MKQAILTPLSGFFFLCIFGFYTSSSFSQTIDYSTTVSASSGQSYSVDIAIELTSIVPTQSGCNNGYNYNVAYNYDIQFNGNAPSNMWTLQGTIDCGTNQGIFFNLPTSPGNGTGTTTGNPWRNVSDCATATVQSLECNSIDIQIQGPGIANQTLTVTPSVSDEGTEWNTDGNSCDTSAFIGTVNQTDLRFRTNNVEHMRLTNEGKFGIGVSNPLEKFELDGSMKLSGDVIFSDYADAIDTTGKFLFVDKDGKTQTKSLNKIGDEIYKPFNCDELLDANGNVVSPQWSNGLNKIYNQCPINVGIRTSTPQFTLDARGQIRSSRNVFVGENAAYSFNNLARMHIVNVGNLAPNNKGDFIRLDDFSTSHGGDNLETVFKVDQNGFVTARDVKVTLQAIPDYVFESDYDLPTIEEQATFIRNNGHLLRMPSESELLQSKLGLGKIVMNNLRISEEQMLYIIEVNQEVEELEEENEELQKRVEELERIVKQLIDQQ